MSSANRFMSDGAMARIVNARDGTSFPCDGNDTILRAALRAGVGMPYSCNTGSCGNCRFDLVDGSVRHLRDDPPAWGARSRSPQAGGSPPP